jgi:hypothetical protein
MLSLQRPISELWARSNPPTSSSPGANPVAEARGNSVEAGALEACGITATILDALVEERVTIDLSTAKASKLL